MQILTAASIFLATIALTTQALAKGINCEGSGACGDSGARLGNLKTLVDPIDPNRVYQNGEHIACDGHQVCCFLQGTGGIRGADIPGLVGALLDHGCGICGSVPVFFFAGDNDISTHGQLTCNFVSSLDGCRPYSLC